MRLSRLARIALVCVPFLASCHTLDGSREAAMNPVVLAELRARGEAHVMVALTDPGQTGGREADIARRRAEIARFQEDVLQSLEPADFRVRQRFEAVPALSGTVLTERGLAVLSAHRHVVRVDLDVGGGGSS